MNLNQMMSEIPLEMACLSLVVQAVHIRRISNKVKDGKSILK